MMLTKLKSLKINKKSALSVGAIICICIICFFSCSIKTEKNIAFKNIDYRRLVTRVPLLSNGFAEPNTGILLSWYDNTVTLSENAEIRLNATVYPVTVLDKTLKYTSSETELAEVDNEGNITLKAPGSVEITVENECTGESAKAYLQIIQPITGFYLQKSTINLHTTDMGVRLASVISPENVSNSTVRWYSKDTSIVEVDQTGHLKPVNIGMTEVVATTVDGGFTAKCFVNIIEEIIKAESVDILNKDAAELNVGGTWTGIASVLPSNAKNRSIEWESSDANIASVTKTGKVQALAPGTVTITAKSTDGPQDTVMITVKGNSHKSEIDLTPTYTAQGGVKYTAYDMTLDEMADLQMPTDPKFNDGTGIKVTTKEKTKQYLDPNEFCTGSYKYQFMDLSHYNGISYAALERFLEGKGTLSGQASAFIEAAKAYNVSELYLVAHACLETGYGSSQLATGVVVNGVRVYNMYGIAAYDGSVISSGSKKAYNEGWTTPREAIMGGAKWISENYINSSVNRQNTLYKMRWNPENPGQHLYAGDVAWAITQSTIMERMFNSFPEASLSYEIPVYLGSNAAVIE